MKTGRKGERQMEEVCEEWREDKAEKGARWNERAEEEKKRERGGRSLEDEKEGRQTIMKRWRSEEKIRWES